MRKLKRFNGQRHPDWVFFLDGFLDGTTPTIPVTAGTETKKIHKKTGGKMPPVFVFSINLFLLGKKDISSYHHLRTV